MAKEYRARYPCPSFKIIILDEADRFVTFEDSYQCMRLIASSLTQDAQSGEIAHILYWEIAFY